MRDTIVRLIDVQLRCLRMGHDLFQKRLTDFENWLEDKALDAYVNGVK